MAWWVRLRLDASHADPATLHGQATLTCAATLGLRRTAEQVRVRDAAVQRARRLVGGAALRLFTSVAMVVALLLVGWAGALYGFAFRTESGTDLSELWQSFAVNATMVQFLLLPALVVGAVELVALARGHTAVYLAGLAAAAVLGLGYLSLPQFVRLDPPVTLWNQLADIGGVWDDASPVVAVFYAGAGLFLCVWSSRRTAAWRLRLGLTYAARPLPARRWRRLLAAPLLLVAMLALTWSAVVVRLTFIHEPGQLTTATAGVAAAGLVSAFALVLTGMAVLPCLFHNGSGLAGLFVAATIVLGVVPPLESQLQMIQRPVLLDIFTGMAAMYGSTAFWAALLLAVPFSVLALRYAFRLLRPIT